MGNQSQTARLLKLFKQRGKLTNRYIADNICLRYSARIAELRAEGHIIVANRIKDGLWEYIYKGASDEAVLDKHIEKISKNPKLFEKGLLNKIKSWL